MAICEIHSYAVPMDTAGGHWGGQGRVMTWCKTHQMEVPQPQTEGLCPLGRIEQATEQALARIQARAIEVLHAKQD
jgi:hypothetical protein